MKNGSRHDCQNSPRTLVWQCLEETARSQSFPFIMSSFSILEIDRHIKALSGGPALIYSKMKVWDSLGIAGVAAGRYRLALRHTISSLNQGAVLFKMCIECHSAIIVLDHDVIVLAGCRLLAIIRKITADLHDQTGTCGDDFSTHRHLEIISELVAMPPFRPAVSLHESIGSPNGIRQYIGRLRWISKHGTL